MDRARAAQADDWIRVDEAIGSHGADAAAAAARTLAAEGLLELHPSDSGLARLPQ